VGQVPGPRAPRARVLVAYGQAVARGRARARDRAPRALVVLVVLVVPRVLVGPVRVARRAAALSGPVPALGRGLAITRSALTRPAWARRPVLTARSAPSATTARAVSALTVATARSASPVTAATAARVRVSPAGQGPVRVVPAAVAPVALARLVSLAR
jgi:hypothetical protein